MSIFRGSGTLIGPLSVALGTLVCLAGCGKTSAPGIEPLEVTTRLMPEVRQGMTITTEEGETLDLGGIEDKVLEHFGTLENPKVWPILPIRFGGTRAQVTKVLTPTKKEADAAQDAEKPFKQLTVIVEPLEGETLTSVPTDAKAGWSLGAEYAGKLAKIVSFDPNSGKLALAGTFDNGLPDLEDVLLLNPGRRLHTGQALYNHYCVYCHGADGGGNGPTADYLNPKPRNFRRGIFKWKSTEHREKISRADLIDTLRDGVPGTAMPSFRLLPEEELQALVAYVQWLSMRGEYEYLLAATADAGYGFTKEAYQERLADGDTREEIMEDVKEYLHYGLPDGAADTGEDIAEAWAEANLPEAKIIPEIARVPDTPASRTRGRKLFRSNRAKCSSCHGPYGEGNGSQTVTFQIDPETDEFYEHVGLYDKWGDPVQPRDLTKGIYRGGRRPIDIYRRIYAGVKGTPMPGAGGSLTDQEIWDLVNFVLHVPYEDLPEPGTGEAIAQAGH